VIARRYGTTVSAIQAANELGRRTLINIGQQLRIPTNAATVAPTTTTVIHRVTRGETLAVIARRYGTTVSAIQAANELGRRTLINIGQQLRIPTVATNQ
jgi:LysM repeat protein